MTSVDGKLTVKHAGADLPLPTRAWRLLLSSAGLLVVVIPLVALGLGAAFSSLTGTTLEAAMRRNAAETARNWANTFVKHFEGFETTLETGALTAEQHRFIDTTRQAGQVYRFKLYDSRGRLVMVSDAPRNGGRDAPPRGYDVHAVKVIQTGRGLVTLDAVQGEPGDPAFPATAYMQVSSSTGEPLGVMAVYIDQTAARGSFVQGLDGLSLKLTVIAVAVFLIPALGFGWRSIEAARRAVQFTAAAAEAETEIALLKSSRELLRRQLFDLDEQTGNQKQDSSIERSPDATPTGEVSLEGIVLDDWLASQLEDQAQALPDCVDLECRLGLGDHLVSCDPSALRLVLAYLLGQAGVGAGKIVIATSFGGRGIELTIFGEPPGSAVTSPTASGNLHENLTTFVEPLFTTKKLGAGLELPAVQRILLRHGGGLNVQSQPGRGAVFTAWWPHAADKKEAA